MGDSFANLFNALDVDVESRVTRAETAGAKMQTVYDDTWVAIKAIAVALDGAGPAAVREILREAGYRV